MGLCETQQFRSLGEDTIGCDECAGIMLKGVKVTWPAGLKPTGSYRSQETVDPQSFWNNPL